MATPRLPKYQAIRDILRRRIDAGDYPPGSRLPPQNELAESFGVTLMTLRQAMSELEADGLVWAARGKGTFVSDRPVDVRLDHLSSLGAQMRAAGVEMSTDVLSVEVVSSDRCRIAARTLGADGELTCVTRRRSSRGVPFGLQRSFFPSGAVPIVEPDDLGARSLYELFEATTGWVVAAARESITAVALSEPDAGLLDAAPGSPAMLSVRTSLSQFSTPFLYDEALLVGDRCTITADRTSNRLSLRYGVVEATDDRQVDPASRRSDGQQT